MKKNINTSNSFLFPNSIWAKIFLLMMFFTVNFLLALPTEIVVSNDASCSTKNIDSSELSANTSVYTDKDNNSPDNTKSQIFIGADTKIFISEGAKLIVKATIIKDKPIAKEKATTLVIKKKNLTKKNLDTVANSPKQEHEQEHNNYKINLPNTDKNYSGAWFFENATCNCTVLQFVATKRSHYFENIDLSNNYRSFLLYFSPIVSQISLLGKYNVRPPTHFLNI